MKRLHRLWIMGGSALVAALSLTAAPLASAQAYPNKPVKIIVTFPPGGTPDIYGRVLAQELSGLWKQSVIVENKTGASGTIGTDINSGGFSFLFSCGINNIFNKSHVAFININSDRKEYYEAGEPRNYFASLNIGYTL